MYVVTVEFIVRPEHVDAFHEAMLAQARHSLERESECDQFDVCVDPTDDRRVFLYKVYIDPEAFGVHLESEHFKSFDTTVRGWVESKDVRTFKRASR